VKLSLDQRKTGEMVSPGPSLRGIIMLAGEIFEASDGSGAVNLTLWKEPRFIALRSEGMCPEPTPFLPGSSPGSSTVTFDGHTLLLRPNKIGFHVEGDGGQDGARTPDLFQVLRLGWTQSQST
jgi:hypothetical protein